MPSCPSRRNRCDALVAAALVSSALIAIEPASSQSEGIPKKGTTPYATHFIFRPVTGLDIPGLGSATLLEAVGTTQNLKGERMFDKMSARCTALNVASGEKKYIDGLRPRRH